MTTRTQQNARRRVSRGFQGTLAAIILLLAVDVTIATDEASNRRPLDLPSGGSLSSVAYGAQEEECDSNVVEFYGALYEGDAFFWCLDRSMSMGSQNPGDKLEMLKAEVSDAIRNLTADNEFGIVSFSTSVTSFRNRPVRATSTQKDSAIKWVNSLQAYGNTCLSCGVVKALEISRRSLMSNRRILLVGDGGPACGGYSSETMLQEIGGANWQHLPIDTIDIASDEYGGKFLQQVARQNNGSYRRID